MRLTTKIVLGIIIATFVISVVYTLHVSSTDSKSEKIIYIPVDEYANLDIPFDYSFIIIDSDSITGISKHIDFTLSSFNIQPLNNEKKNKKASVLKGALPYTSYSKQGDTLLIHINLKNLKGNDNSSENMMIKSEWTLHTDLPVYIRSKINGLGIKLLGLNCKSINVSAQRGIVSVANCRTTSLSLLQRGHYSLCLDNSMIDTLNVNLDYVSSLRIKNCDIDIENLTGSRKHKISLSKAKANTVNWYPKKNDAKLNISLEADTARVIFFK